VDIPTIEDMDELAALVAERAQTCVRYSKGPDEDRQRSSVDYESGLELPGLSVIPLRPEPWWTRDPRDWIARQLCHYAHLQDESGNERRPWLLAGNVVGYGPDREPLLDPWEAIAWLSESAVDQARTRYEKEFDAGRDSAA
jgi:hypothetical protein